MRSRYTAYALGRVEYLLATWHSTTRPAGLDLTTPPQPRWIGLKIVAAATPAPHRGTVEFIARYRLAGRAHLMHEISRFVLEDGRWYYLDGEAIT